MVTGFQHTIQRKLYFLFTAKSKIMEEPLFFFPHVTAPHYATLKKAPRNAFAWRSGHIGGPYLPEVLAGASTLSSSWKARNSLVNPVRSSYTSMCRGRVFWWCRSHTPSCDWQIASKHLWLAVAICQVFFK